MIPWIRSATRSPSPQVRVLSCTMLPFGTGVAVGRRVYGPGAGGAVRCGPAPEPYGYGPRTGARVRRARAPDPYVCQRTDLIGRTASAPRTESTAPARKSAV
ncbi:hypothetical protein GCM10010331_28970 [Streptomyces xanthochromogenes]|nr:hypothetical protein GCM10010331_28970 [Streptomyces xanthochromogenes]